MGGRRRRWRARTIGATVAAAGLLGGLAAGPLGSAGATVRARSSKQAVTITLYNGQHIQTTAQLVQGFERAHPGIEVAVRNGDEDTLVDQLVQEGGRSPADVVFTENSPALQFLQQKGLLAKLRPATLARTPKKYDSQAGDWVGVAARVSMLVYNPKLIAKGQLPSSVMDMAKPRYKGKIAFAEGESDFQPIVTAVLRKYGKARAIRWLDGLKANAGDHLYPDDETIAEQVNRGQVAFGIVNQYYWYRMRAELGASRTVSRLAYFAPRDPGYVLDVSPAGVLASSRHKAAAQALVAYLVSKAGQEIINRSVSFEYPIASGVTMARKETPFSQLRPNPITLAQLGTGAQAIALLREAQLL